ncbi:hypothetical protein O3P69_016786 [Scylla paramamosain]|uniref:Secreted protein n=1 Tax=Scylla paramamosain TaxID=85552 RepID=A0AAW0SYN4_SCYPA
MKAARSERVWLPRVTSRLAATLTKSCLCSSLPALRQPRRTIATKDGAGPDTCSPLSSFPVLQVALRIPRRCVDLLLRGSWVCVDEWRLAAAYLNCGSNVCGYLPCKC